MQGRPSPLLRCTCSNLGVPPGGCGVSPTWGSWSCVLGLILVQRTSNARAGEGSFVHTEGTWNWVPAPSLCYSSGVSRVAQVLMRLKVNNPLAVGPWTTNVPSLDPQASPERADTVLAASSSCLGPGGSMLASMVLSSAHLRCQLQMPAGSIQQELLSVDHLVCLQPRAERQNLGLEEISAD